MCFRSLCYPRVHTVPVVCLLYSSVCHFQTVAVGPQALHPGEDVPPQTGRPLPPPLWSPPRAQRPAHLLTSCPDWLSLPFDRCDGHLDCDPGGGGGLLHLPSVQSPGEGRGIYSCVSHGDDVGGAGPLHLLISQHQLRGRCIHLTCPLQF